MWRIVLIAFLPGLAFAGSVEDEAQGCMHLSNPVEMRSCLSEVFHRRDFEMDLRIAAATARVTGSETLDAEVMTSRLAADQASWRIGTEQRCKAGDPILRQLCRLGSLQVREQQLSLELDSTLRDFGWE